MIHMGHSLKVFIEEGGASVGEISTITGISRQGVNGLYGQVSFDKSYIDKLKKEGLKIPGVTAEGGTRINDSSEEEKLNQEIKYLKELLKSKDELIAALRGVK